MKKTLVFMTIICSLLGITQALAEEKQPTVVDIKRMSLDVALQLANAAIEQCRKEGVQVAVTVVDRGGHPQVVLRNVLAQDLTLTISRMKAYTAMSFNMATSAMEGRFTSPFSIGKVDGIVIAAGGVPVTASGNIIGGVGVSGAPSGETDEKCAKAGVDAISDELEMATM
jgi:uncharacterized protein GlcG (DUF336 family)